MTRARRHAIAVVLVATALCADRSTVSAAPAGSPHQPSSASQTSSLAARFVSRISAGFRRAVPGVQIIYQAREDHVAQPPSAVAFVRTQPSIALHGQPPLSPFQFRLPPPTL